MNHATMNPTRHPAVNARNVAILVFDEIEVLDFAGPFEVFSVAAAEMPATPYRPFFPYTLGLTPRSIETYGGMTVTPRFCLHDCPPPDILIVPGGNGARRLLTHGAFLAWLDQHSRSAEIVASVCTGALALARAGVLAGRRATTHHGAFARLAELDPTVQVVTDQRYVQDGKVWTSGGISAGIDMSLAIVKSLLGSNEPVATEMEWMWHQRLTAPPA
jgi:transcriptional regulator GlxA family with amidase domain